jgi:hypothetical protein
LRSATPRSSPAEVDDGAPFADGRKVSGMLVAERGRAFGDRLAKHHLDAEPLERPPCMVRHARTRLDQRDPRLSRVDVAEIGGQRGLLLGLALRALEGEQNAAADCRRVFEGLQARGEGLPIVVAEIGVPRAGRLGPSK